MSVPVRGIDLERPRDRTSGIRAFARHVNAPGRVREVRDIGLARSADFAELAESLFPPARFEGDAAEDRALAQETWTRTCGPAGHGLLGVLEGAAEFALLPERMRKKR